MASQGPEKCIQVHFDQPGKKFQSHKDRPLSTHICLTFKFVPNDCCYFCDNYRLRFRWKTLSIAWKPCLYSCSIPLYFKCITTGRWLLQGDANKVAMDTVTTQCIRIRFHHVSHTSPNINYLLGMNLVILGAENTGWNDFFVWQVHSEFFYTSLQELIVQSVSNLYEEYVCYSPYNL